MAFDSERSIPWNFGSQTIFLTNFSSTGTILFETDRIPPNYLGRIRDMNVIFTTTGGGVHLTKKSAGGGSKRFTDAFTANSTGLVATVVGQDVIEVVLDSTGSGVVDFSADGEIVPTRLAQQLKLQQRTNEFDEEGL